MVADRELDLAVEHVEESTSAGCVCGSTVKPGSTASSRAETCGASAMMVSTAVCRAICSPAPAATTTASWESRPPSAGAS